MELRDYRRIVIYTMIDCRKWSVPIDDCFFFFFVSTEIVGAVLSQTAYCTPWKPLIPEASRYFSYAAYRFPDKRRNRRNLPGPRGLFAGRATAKSTVTVENVSRILQKKKTSYDILEFEHFFFFYPVRPINTVTSVEYGVSSCYSYYFFFIYIYWKVYSIFLIFSVCAASSSSVECIIMIFLFFSHPVVQIRIIWMYFFGSEKTVIFYA